MNALISVIVPCYNMAQYLEEAVTSIVNQSFGDWECIIVNDGSTDDTTKIANRIISSSHGHNIRLIEKENGGTADARNKGIEASRGEWILPLDADDALHRNFMSKCTSVFARHPRVNLVYTDATIFGSRNGTASLEPYSDNGILLSNRLPYASLYKKSLWEAVGGYDSSIPWGVEDWNFWICCSKAGLSVYQINEPLLNYRVHEDGSRNAKAMSRWGVVSAAMMTLHPDKYPLRQLLSAHKILANMHGDTIEEIVRITDSFQELPMPYFWLGLAAESGGRRADAMHLYEKSVLYAAEGDWQSRLYLYRLLRQSGSEYPESLQRGLMRGLGPEFLNIFCRKESG